MARSLSTTVKQNLFVSQTQKVFIVLLKIKEPTIPTRYITSDGVDTVHNGKIWKPYPFRITLPHEEADRQPQVQLTIDAIDKSIIADLRSINTPPKITMKVIVHDDLDTVIIGPIEYKLRQVSFDAQVITGELYFQDTLNESFPAQSYTPNRFPGLFQ